MQQQIQQLQQEREKPVVSDQQAIMAQVRREMAFEKAKMMAEVEQAMKEKEEALVEKITAKLQGTTIEFNEKTSSKPLLVAGPPPDAFRTENLNKNFVAGLSDDAVRAELDRMFIRHKLGLEKLPK